VVTTPTIHVTRDRYHLAWDPAIAPIATMDSGGVVEFDLLDASCGQLDADCGVPQLLGLNFERVDQVGGPIAVNGAEPGDTLQIDLLDFEPASWGWTAVIPGFGLLADEFPDPSYHVAPEAGPLSTIPPDVFGGNMDTRHLVAGSTLYLPVFQRGAGLSAGDGHATQGDGEVCGTAIETPMRATMRLTVRKDLHVSAPEFLAAPDPHAELRNGPRYATDGVGPDLLGAARDATRRMIDWLGREHGLAPAQAYMLCSVAVDLRISEIVDMPNYVVTAYCPLGIFA
jgi:acetamidase/formamidase